jgi:hypothetical protein
MRKSGSVRFPSIILLPIYNPTWSEKRRDAMNVLISSQKERDYILIKLSGTVQNIEEWMSLTKQYHEEIGRFDSNKVIIDQIELDFPTDLHSQCKIIDFYAENLPHEHKFLKLAIVMNSKYKSVATVWELLAYNHGYNYKAFCSMEEACMFMSGQEVDSCGE